MISLPPVGVVSKITAGQGFGETALMSPDDLRSASLVADQEGAVLLCVSRTNYLRAMRMDEGRKNEVNECVDFIPSLELFKCFNHRQIMQLGFGFHRRSLLYNEMVATAGTLARCMNLSQCAV